MYRIKVADILARPWTAKPNRMAWPATHRVRAREFPLDPVISPRLPARIRIPLAALLSLLALSVSALPARTQTDSRVGGSNSHQALGQAHAATAIHGVQESNVYTWNQSSGTAAWGTPTNWTPDRNAPASDDILVFDNGGTFTVTDVPTQTIAQFFLVNHTSVTLKPAAGGASLSITGGPGADFEVPEGSVLALDASVATDSLEIALSDTATGAVAGILDVTGGPHRIVAKGSNALEFLEGSLASTHGTGFFGNLFGKGDGSSALNSVVFRSGSTYSEGAGSNPFGATAPQSVVTFEAGSLFRVDADLSPSLSGRTYADFEYHTTGSIFTTPAGPLVLDNLKVSQGMLHIGNTGTVTVRGSIEVSAGATLDFDPASGTPSVTLNGLAAPGGPTIRADGVLTCSPNESFEIALPARTSVGLETNVFWPGSIHFTSGGIAARDNMLALGASSTVTGASQSTGWVTGSLRRPLSGDPVTMIYDVGDSSSYTPMTVTMTGLVAPFDLAADAYPGDHPSLAGSTLDPAKSVNHWWQLTPTGTPTFTAYDVTFGFQAADVDAGANPNAFLVERRASGTWSPTATGVRTATSTQATGLGVFGDFAVAEPLRFTMTVTAAGNGSVVKSPDQSSYDYGTVVTLSAVPATGWHFVGWSGDASGATNPLGVTMDADKAITATFAIDTHTLTLAVVGSGLVTKSIPQ